MELCERLKSIKLLLSDVDGVMNDGRIYYLPTPERVEVAKFFNVKDGLGIKLLKLAGIKFGVVSGRKDRVVEKRCTDLGCDFIVLGVGDKASAVEEIIQREGLKREEVCYVGDDWNDFPAFEIVGFAVTVADAPEELKLAADYVVPKRGGEGVIRYLVDNILKCRGVYSETVQKFLKGLKG